MRSQAQRADGLHTCMAALSEHNVQASACFCSIISAAANQGSAVDNTVEALNKLPLVLCVALSFRHCFFPLSGSLLCSPLS